MDHSSGDVNGREKAIRASPDDGRAGKRTLRGQVGPEHHQEDEGEIEEDQRPALVEVPELAGDQQGGGQGDQLAEVLLRGQNAVTITSAR